MNEILSFLIICCFGGLFILIFEKIFYKIIILFLALLNEDAQYDNIKKNVILDLAKKNKTWFLVAKELELFVNEEDFI